MTFHLDPVLVLADPDPLHWAVRVAAFNVAQAERKAAAEAAKK